MLYLLIHFGAAAYTDMGTRLRAVQEAREIFPNLITGTDWAELLL